MNLRNKLSIAGCAVILAGTIIIGSQTYQDRQNAVIKKSVNDLNMRELTVAAKDGSTSENKESSTDTDSAKVGAKGDDVKNVKKAESGKTKTAQDTSSSTTSANQTKKDSSTPVTAPKKNDTSVKDKPSSSTSIKKNEPPSSTPSKDKENTSGLHFSSREEAIQYGTSRLSAEELEIYRKASAKGLSAGQEALAFQVASSRFSSEELQALKEALNK